MTRDELLARLEVLLGGRVSEEIIFGDISTGAQNDLQRATDIARSMVMEYGMSAKLGPLTYVSESRSAHLDLGFGSREREFSERTAQQIDEEVYGIVEASHQNAREILTSQRGMLEKLAKILLEKESMEGEELKKFVEEVKAGLIAKDSSRPPVQDVNRLV
jgi:cell division protease FtsH